MKLKCEKCCSVFYKEERLNKHNCKSIIEKQVKLDGFLDYDYKYIEETVQVRSLGDENLEHITFGLFKDIITNKKRVPHVHLIVLVHLNDKFPENNNIRFNTDGNRDFGYIKRNNIWEKHPVKEVLFTLHRSVQRIMSLLIAKYRKQFIERIVEEYNDIMDGLDKLVDDDVLNKLPEESLKLPAN